MTNVLADTGDASRELARSTTGSAPEELNVNARDSFNPEFMKDMHSACRPEKDGYFGSTYGDPVRLTYGFRLETKPLSSIVDMIDLVEDRIVDSILSKSFPNLCGFGGRRLTEGRASGFRFLKLVGKGKKHVAWTEIEHVQNWTLTFVDFFQRNVSHKLVVLISAQSLRAK